MSAGSGFGTAGLRTIVLDAWRAAPARFREDANAEDELVRGAYRDRVIVELAQNAADAAARLGQRARVLLELTDTHLRVANTGAALDAAGVQSLCTLRASTKREQGTVGRFGVGFAAVLAVTDEPRIHGWAGGVGWSAQRSLELVADEPALAEEVARRGGHVPVLRLPFDADGSPPTGYDTVVELPLRDAAALALARDQLHAAGEGLLLALPTLAEIEVRVEGSRRVLRSRQDGPDLVLCGDRESRWATVSRRGATPAAQLADRTVEERWRTEWHLSWATPLAASGPQPLPDSVPAVVHAPTPTDDPLDLSALLIASFPLDSGRRRVVSGPLTDALIAEAALAYGELVVGLAERFGAEAMALVPGPVAAGELDAQLRRRIAEVLAETPFLPTAAPQAGPVRPRDAVLVPGAAPALIAALVPVVPGLLPLGWTDPALARLGVRRMEMADLVAELAGLGRDPSWWRQLYSCLGAVDPEELAGLPVPLVDGRLVRGVAGALVPGEIDAATLAVLGLRAVEPEASHPVLERLGAQAATAEAVLGHPGFAAAVRAAADAEPAGQRAVAAAALTVVRAALPLADPPSWLADLMLTDDAAQPVPAGELVLPDAVVGGLFEPDALGPVEQCWVRDYGLDALRAVGVLDGFALVRDTDVGLDPDTCDHDLDAEDEWVDVVAGAGAAPDLLMEFVAVRDLDLVRDQAWPRALELLARPPLRAAVVEPARVRRSDGRVADVRSYTAWWLSTHRILAGDRPADRRLPGSDPRLVGLWPPVELGTGDAEFARAIGVRADLADILAEPGGLEQVLARLADPAREMTAGQLVAVYAAVAECDPDAARPPSRLRVPAGSGTVVVDAAQAVVLDAPDLIPLLAGRAAVPAPIGCAGGLADVLDLDLASELIPGIVESEGVAVPVPDIVDRVLGVASPRPRHYLEHDVLTVDGHSVAWRWVDPVLHVSTLEGLAEGLAWATGRWPRRWLLGAVLADPEVAAELLLADGLG